MLPGERGKNGTPASVRCAIYTRKSTEEGLSQEFNSLVAQRECAEAYIQSQRNQGWIVLPDRYDDGGFTGANLDRPALKRLLGDIEARRIDCIVIYKVDRLSRSLFDFTRLMQVFEKNAVSFVSVTQQFNSSTPMGRLTMNILLSFAEFERHVIGERTRDKISAARRKGKWMGGYPVLGYDADPSRSRLVVNETEAVQVREIFEMFVRHEKLIPSLEEIRQRGFRLKSWTTRKGGHHAGRAFDRHSLVRLLANIVYLGQTKYKGKVYPGEQPAIVDRKLSRERNRQGALLTDLLICAGCGKSMVAGYTTKGGRRYRYYVCVTAQKRGVRACRGKLVSAERIEQATVDELYELAGQPGGEALQQVLPAETAGWEELGREEQRRIVAGLVVRILYDRRLHQGVMRLREAAGLTGGDVVIRGGKQPLVWQTAPGRAEAGRQDREVLIQGGVPRITKLLALAVRFEELLRNGTAKDYADLARLGAVSASRITQIMNLRNLAPALQERILGHDSSSEVRLNERTLRRLGGIIDWREQIVQFDEISGRRNGDART